MRRASRVHQGAIVTQSGTWRVVRARLQQEHAAASRERGVEWQDMHAGGERIPVLRPRLPDAEALLPYLRRIDASRQYTNWGPLALEFEGRIAALLGCSADGVVSSSSGTAALVGAILAATGRPPAGTAALVPAFTFVATALAAEQAG